jgi:hypothetical protein
MIAIIFNSSDNRFHLMAPGRGDMVLPAGADPEAFGNAVQGQIAAECGVQLQIVRI